MRLPFDIRVGSVNSGEWVWFRVKFKYDVKIFLKTGEGLCSCLADTFKQAGRHQKECKHIRACRNFLEAIKIEY